MKKFNLSEIMKTAHRTYKYFGKKQGKTFGEVLKSTWRMAKLNATMAESREIKDKEDMIKAMTNKAEREAANSRREAQLKADVLKEETAARKQGISVNEYREKVSFQMGYGRGLYCGD